MYNVDRVMGPFVDSSNQDLASSSTWSVLYFRHNTWKFTEFIRCLILCKHFYRRRLIIGFSCCVPLQIGLALVHAKQSCSPVPLWTCFPIDGRTLNHRPARLQYPVPWNIVEISPRINLDCVPKQNACWRRAIENYWRADVQVSLAGCHRKSWCTSLAVKLHCDKMRHFQLHCVWSKRFFELVLFWSGWH